MEFITQNRQKNVKITAASFQNTVKLKQAVMKCLLDANVMKDVGDIQNLGLSGIIDKVLNVLFSAEISGGFEKAVFDCLGVCIYDDKYKITPQLFDDIPDAREDYYEIVSKCVEVNLRPFFKSLVSELKTRFKTLSSNFPEQELQQEKISI